MFRYPHYVPVLRWKKAERMALQALRVDCRPFVTPLIEVTPRALAYKSRKTGKLLPIGLQISRIAQSLKEAWPHERSFVDLSILGHNFRLLGKPVWSPIGDALSATDSAAVPVVGLAVPSWSSNASVRDFANSSGRGLCLRLKQIDFFTSALAARIDERLSSLAASPAEVDLICDLQCYYDGGKTPQEVCSALPYLSLWRSFTLLAGDFPSDLTDYQPRTEQHRRRGEWVSWKRSITNGVDLPRLPAFGDYTIQFGEYRPPIKGAHPSGSVRYTFEDKWLILRGEDITKKDGPGRKQWTAWAMLLIERPEFQLYGSTFSEGDLYIHERTMNLDDPGTPQTWLFAGINHHLTVAATQIRQLSSP